MFKYLILLATLSLPFFTHAEVSNARELIEAVMSLISSLTPIVASIAFMVFLWGLGRYVYHSDSEDSREEGKRLMFWGIIGLFAMFSVWGIVNFVASNLGVDGHPAKMLYTL